MAREPHYPEDAPVGEATGNETPAKKSDQSDAADKAGNSNRTRNLVAGAAIGIGSAALVAALLYASRSRKGEEPPRPPPPDAED